MQYLPIPHHIWEVTYRATQPAQLDSEQLKPSRLTLRPNRPRAAQFQSKQSNQLKLITDSGLRPEYTLSVYMQKAWAPVFCADVPTQAVLHMDTSCRHHRLLLRRETHTPLNHKTSRIMTDGAGSSLWTKHGNFSIEGEQEVEEDVPAGKWYSRCTIPNSACRLASSFSCAFALPIIAGIFFLKWPMIRMCILAALTRFTNSFTWQYA